MSEVIRKVFFVWNEREEKLWLEDMAKKGYKLTGVRLFKYTFESCEPMDLVYQFDFKGIKQDDLDEYLQLYEDAGWEKVATMGSWYYFCRERDKSEEMEIFNNDTSRSELYKRLILFLLLTGFPLYYQALIFIPALSLQGELGLFYRILQIIVYPLTLVHLYALVRILASYRKYKTGLKE